MQSLPVLPLLAALILSGCASPNVGPELALEGLPAFGAAEIETETDGRCYARPVDPRFDARERREGRFETLCPPAYTLALVESLQRALTARGAYRGPISGRLDAETRRAVQDFQRTSGPDSPLLSLRTARDLGLVPLSPRDLEELTTLG